MGIYIRNQDFLKIGFQRVGAMAKAMVPTIEHSKSGFWQHGSHFFWIWNGQASWFQIQFEIQAIQNLDMSGFQIPIFPDQPDKQ